MKQALAVLNEAFPAPAVPTLIDYKAAVKQEDPYFHAYYSRHINGWWIVCTHYTTWRDFQDYIQTVAQWFTQQTGAKCMDCQQHPVAIADLQRCGRTKEQGVEVFLGVCTFSQR